MLAAALAAAEEQGTLMDIAVVDAGGNLKAFARMDGAWLGSIDIATTKARTARYFDLPTRGVGRAVAAGRAALRHRGLQRRPDHLPRRTAAEGRRMARSSAPSASPARRWRTTTRWRGGGGSPGWPERRADPGSAGPALLGQPSGGGGPSGGVLGD